VGNGSHWSGTGRHAANRGLSDSIETALPRLAAQPRLIEALHLRLPETGQGLTSANKDYKTVHSWNQAAKKSLEVGNGSHWSGTGRHAANRGLSDSIETVLPRLAAQPRLIEALHLRLPETGQGLTSANKDLTKLYALGTRLPRSPLRWEMAVTGQVQEGMQQTEGCQTVLRLSYPGWLHNPGFGSSAPQTA
jgi:hypothetical protein